MQVFGAADDATTPLCNGLVTVPTIWFVEVVHRSPPASSPRWGDQRGDPGTSELPPSIIRSGSPARTPILILYVVGRRQLFSGLTAGFGK
jgi:hypothetical protein